MLEAPRSFPIIDVSEGTPEKSEQMGSKEKFWLRRGSDEPWLFKFSRPERGEDWAEKIAAEVAGAIGVPHAQVELASRHGRNGTISRSFVEEGSELVHGNELLAEVLQAYPRHALRTSQHRLEDVLDVLRRLRVGRPSSLQGMREVADGADAFVGCLMLDALIGNTDRHHENWGALRKVQPGDDAQRPLTLAPSYDHASSLGRDVPAVDMVRRLSGADQRFSVASYARRAESKLHAADGSSLSTMEAFRLAATARQSAGRAWLDRLAAIDGNRLAAIVRQVPPTRLPASGHEFVAELLRLNREQLLGATPIAP